MRAAASLWALGVGVLLTLAPPAQAQLAQPVSPNDNPQPVSIPVPVSAGEMGDTQGFNPTIPMAGQYVTLPALFKYRGETIDFQMDAKTEPATFSPLCSFSGTLVLRGGGCQLAFGWYNAVQSGGPPPAANEIYPLIPNNDPVVYRQAAFAPLAVDPPMVGGMPAWALKTFTASDIRNDARYKGGEIGFALIGDSATACKQTKFSQRALNQVCTACTPMEPWIQTVVYASTKEDNAYYLGFEDLPSDPTSFKAKNDGDFNDFVFYITGLVCAGGGEPCDTGLKGACAVGKTDCSEAGKPGQCRQVVKPNKEECDNVDNDCNGMVDDGDLCPEGKVCDHGSCVAACGTGEFRCPLELECEKGFCIDPLCKGKDCGEGKACRAGQCVGLCDGVLCPTGQECQLGRCVDLCAGVTCLEKQVCENGLCLSECGCRACGDGKTCGTEGKCVDTGCEKMTCGTGQVCVKGACKDPCDGAACPGNGACVDGQCQAPMAMVGGSGGGGGAAGGDGIGGINVGGSGFVIGGAGMTGTTTAGTGSNGVKPILKSGETATGCNCRAAGGSSDTSSRSHVAWLAAALLGSLLARRRR
jgi:MYXO-CTERM domain-containing protein